MYFQEVGEEEGEEKVSNRTINFCTEDETVKTIELTMGPDHTFAPKSKQG